MASRCNRFMNKASISSLKSAFKSTYIPKSAPSSPKSPLPTRSTASPLSRFFMSRHMSFPLLETEEMGFARPVIIPKLGLSVPR
ncbi:uncharacterized protein LOC112522293 isoform X4 [Cynara cardunculus var. scolymus]|uniref:Uncharacterized protein n=1 Tax=Cynara cardunculus var. scolymus TaxID=59895 RepID=A0A103XFJ3_CYNCS|nr:uncharacterized protein LOC112522293 isoform X4 [Cynara cardunculus var. scolymus]KVH89806.1 hypothetical protein Ccrd_008214 [Cynara cardunculus var. scolymus]